MPIHPRSICYHCFRPESSCMCAYITPLETQTRFVILMHPKEFRKTKNGTGHFTNLSLKNCELHIGIDFTTHTHINGIIEDPNNHCLVLYPSQNAINLNEEDITKAKKQTVIFLIDATWPCSRAMLTASPNIDRLSKVSFSHTKRSAFVFKEQPKEYCLSTMESTLCVLELLQRHQAENISQDKLQAFLRPFHKMVKHQLSYT